MLSCYKVLFSTVRYGRDANNEVTADRFSTERSRFVVAPTEHAAGDFIRGDYDQDGGVDEVHVQQVAAVAKDVAIATEAATEEPLHSDHPQMTGLIPPEASSEAPGV